MIKLKKLLSSAGDFVKAHHRKCFITLVFMVAVTTIVIIVAAIISSLPVLTEGIVIDRIHEAAYISRRTTYDDDGYQVINDTKHDEAFYIVVVGVTEKGDERKETWKVTSFVYEKVQENDRVYRNPSTGVVSVTGK